MEDIIWKKLKTIDSSNLNFIHYYKLDVEISYSEIEVLYENYISKYYFETHTDSIFSDNDVNKISLKLSLFESGLSLVIEKIFESSVHDIEDSLILFYLRYSEEALILFKSFYPLSEIDEVRLPHFCYRIKNQETVNKLKKQFEENEDLCIMHCSN